MSTSAIGVRAFSCEPPPSTWSFLFSEECWDSPFELIEIFESSEVFPVDSTLGAVDDLPLLE